MKSLRILRELLKRHPKFLLIAVPLLTLSSCVEGISIIGLAPVIDLLIQSDARPASGVTVWITGWMRRAGLPVSIVSVMAVFLVLVLVKNAVAAFARFIVTKLHFRLVEETMTGLFQRFLCAQWPFFVANSYGVLGNTLMRETEKIGLAFEEMAKILSNVIRASVYLGVAVFLSWQLTGLAVVLTGLALMPFFLLGRLTYRIGAIHTRAGNEFQGVVIETLSAAKLILGFGNQRRSLRALISSLGPYLTTAVQFTMVRLITPLAFEPVGLLIAFTVLYLGYSSYRLDLSSLFIILYVLRAGADMLMQATNDQNNLQNILPSLEQIDRLKEEAGRMAQPSGTRPFARLEREIMFRGVRFAYPNHADTLQDITLVVPKGKMTAVVGRSGAGKTTLIDLLMGFYEAQAGQVLVDGVPLHEFDILSWRQRIGFVPQDPFLFHASIQENLLWANERASPADVEEACERANAREFIEQLPHRLETVVGDRGIRLSGGQRQRIALARALLRKPELLILDEATSALDSHSELLIQESVEQISRSITVVAIAHRLSTIKKADCIHVLEKGSIVESGSFEQLMQIHGGEFFRTAELQGLSVRD